MSSDWMDITNDLQIGNAWRATTTFFHKIGYMTQVTSKGNEAKSKMKHPLDMPTPRFELRWLRFVANCLTNYTMDHYYYLRHFALFDSDKPVIRFWHKCMANIRRDPVAKIWVVHCLLKSTLMYLTMYLKSNILWNHFNTNTNTFYIGKLSYQYT